MIKRCVEVSGGPFHLSLRDAQLVLSKDGQEAGRVPIEDLGVLVVDHPAVTYTHGVLSAMTENNVAVIICGRNRHPAGLLLPMEGHTVQAETISLQAAIGARLKDRLWKEIISAKIANQAAALSLSGKDGGLLRTFSRQVRPGDSSNIEGRAAREYWQRLFGPQFRRGRDGAPPNGLLNYGYMVLRAAVARAVCGAGLHPSLGIHHRNRYNAFALADDLIEPFRPLVDIEALRLYEAGETTPSKNAKAGLIGTLSATVELNGRRSPLMTAIQSSAASLRRVIAGEGERLELPRPAHHGLDKEEEEEDG